MTRKITKKELSQPDFFQLASAKIVKFVSENIKKIFVISGGIFLILLIVAAYVLYQTNNEKKAQILYTKAYFASLAAAKAGNQADSSNLKLYQDVISQYPGTKSAATAYYRIGNLYYRLNNIDEAIKAYKEYLNRTSEKSELRALVYISLGYCYETKKDLKTALDYYGRASKTKTGGNFEGMNLRNIARMYEKMNQKEKALEYYRKSLEKATDPSVEQFIKRKITMLE
jgi:tetratricopeptide (TPR) repeat protein